MALRPKTKGPLSPTKFHRVRLGTETRVYAAQPSIRDVAIPRLRQVGAVEVQRRRRVLACRRRRAAARHALVEVVRPAPSAAHRQNVLPEPYSAKSVKWGRRVSHSLRCEATGPIALGRLYDTGPIGYRAAVALTGSSRSSAPRE